MSEGPRQRPGPGAAGWEPPAPFTRLDREGWAALGRGRAPVGARLPAGSPLTTDEWTDVYVPLAHIVGMHLDGRVELRRRLEAAGWRGAGAGPFLLGLGGSVAVGKSTSAHALAALLAARADHPVVTVVSTDGFLLPNAALTARGLLARKGFPESYDHGLATGVLGRIALGYDDVEIPRYSHRVFDIVDPPERLGRPDVVILEGVNALAPPVAGFCALHVFLDAAEGDLRAWFARRFTELVAEAAEDPSSFFAQWVGLDDGDVRALALGVWEHINRANLVENILPTRWSADIVVRKGRDHAVTDVALRLR